MLTDNDKKAAEMSELMSEKLDVPEVEVEGRLKEIGTKGLGMKDSWTYWRNR